MVNTTNTKVRMSNLTVITLELVILFVSMYRFHSIKQADERKQEKRFVYFILSFLSFMHMFYNISYLYIGTTQFGLIQDTLINFANFFVIIFWFKKYEDHLDDDIIICEDADAVKSL